ncbi:MAG: hypothetical protein AAB523_02175 [Patescibacteria group bacterium]
MIKRAIADVCILLSVLYAPWWVTAFIGILFVFYFSNYYELIAAGVLVDVLYGNNSTPLFHIPFIFSIDSVVFYVLVQFLKTKMRMYI